MDNLNFQISMYKIMEVDALAGTYSSVFINKNIDQESKIQKDRDMNLSKVKESEKGYFEKIKERENRENKKGNSKNSDKGRRVDRLA